MPAIVQYSTVLVSGHVVRGVVVCARTYPCRLRVWPLMEEEASTCDSVADSPSFTTSEESSGCDQSPEKATEECQSPIANLMKRTGYSIVQQNGQRRYGPPPDWEGPPPPRGCEIFVGKIPRDCFEDELVPVFEKAGRIYELRLMMDFSGQNRGYAFVVYSSPSEAKDSVKMLNNYEIRKGRTLGICMSVDNCRLFVGGIPKKVSRLGKRWRKRPPPCMLGGSLCVCGCRYGDY